MAQSPTTIASALLHALATLLGALVGVVEGSALLVLAQRLLLAIYAPVRLVISLLDLYRELCANPAMRTNALAKADDFAQLLARLPTLADAHATKLARRSERWQGRGIVVVAGGPRYGALACELVASLRAAGCTLPIEVFYLGSKELNCEAMDALVAMEGVAARDLLSGQPTLCDEPGFGFAAVSVIAYRTPHVLAATRAATCTAKLPHVGDRVCV